MFLNPHNYPTLRERDAIATQARRDAIESALHRLPERARAHHGRYLVFGSVARGQIRSDSDLDLIADFPTKTIKAAIEDAATICFECGVPYDIIELRGETDRRFLHFALTDAKEIE